MAGLGRSCSLDRHAHDVGHGLHPQLLHGLAVLLLGPVSLRRRRRRRRPRPRAAGGAPPGPEGLRGRRVGVLRVCCPLVRLVRRLTDLASTAREGLARGAAGRDEVGRHRGPLLASTVRVRAARGDARAGLWDGKTLTGMPTLEPDELSSSESSPPPRPPPSRNRLSVLVAVQRHVLSSSLASTPRSAALAHG